MSLPPVRVVAMEAAAGAVKIDKNFQGALSIPAQERDYRP
jgi:hypothetical protein